MVDAGGLGTGSDPSDFDASTEGIVIAGPAEGIVIAGPAEGLTEERATRRIDDRDEDGPAEFGSTGRWERDDHTDPTDGEDDRVEAKAADETYIDDTAAWTPDDELAGRADVVEELVIEPPSLGPESDVVFDG